MSSILTSSRIMGNVLSTVTATIDPSFRNSDTHGVPTKPTKIFEVNGKSFVVNSLDPLLDQAFITLYKSYLCTETIDLSDFKAESIKFFTNNPDRTIYEHHDAYFENFTALYYHFLDVRNYDQAEDVWSFALSLALSWEESNPGKLLHKGTPYYFWGMVATLRGDIDKGYTLMHRAVQEDQETTGKDAPRTAGIAFVGIDYENVEQAFYQWVHDQFDYLAKRQQEYSASYSRPFTMNDFRAKFLMSPPNLDTLFLFAHTVARLMKVSSVSSHILQSQFAAQLEANILFDLLLVIDAVIKAKNNKRYFKDHANYLSLKAGAELSITHLIYINGKFDGKAFDSTLANILDGKFTLSNGTGLSKIQSDIAVAYGLRNHGAHRVLAIPTICDRFRDVEQAIFNVLFAAVDF
jgi:hypothetical protein